MLLLLSSSPPASLEKSTRSFRFIISWSFRFRTAEEAESEKRVSWELCRWSKAGKSNGRTCVWVFCKAKALRPASLLVIYQPEIQDFSSRTKDVYYLLFRETCEESVEFLPWSHRGKATNHREYCLQRPISKAVSTW